MRTASQAYALALRQVREELARAGEAASAVLAARTRIWTELGERSKRGESYDPVASAPEMDEGVQCLERTHQDLRSAFEASNARLAADWPPSRLDRMSVDLPTTVDWRRPYRLQFGWYFIVPLIVSGAAMLVLPMVAFRGADASASGAAGTTPRPLVCYAARTERSKPDAGGILTLRCEAPDPPSRTDR